MRGHKSKSDKQLPVDLVNISEMAGKKTVGN